MSPSTAARSPPSPLTAYVATLGMVAAATGIAVLIEQIARVPNLSLLFVLPVVIAAAFFGWAPAIVAAATGVAAYNFFLIPPLHTFVVSDPSNVLALVFLLIVGAIVSAVAAYGRRQALNAARAARQAEALSALARRLVGVTDRAAASRAAAEALRDLFDRPAAVFLEIHNGLDKGQVAGEARLTEQDAAAAAWSLASRLATRGGAYPSGEAQFDFWPIVSSRRQSAVLGVSLDDPDRGRPGHPEQLVEAVAGHLALALDRDALATEVLAARVAQTSEQLKADLLAAVSHDLKTPLATILVSLQGLVAFDAAYEAEERSELLRLAEAETSRLTRLVEDLLDMGRIDAEGVAAQIRAERPDDLIMAALEQAGAALEGRRLVREIGATLPLNVDRGLFASALAKVLENAARYGPEGSVVRVRSGSDAGQAWIEVEDEGPGFPDAAEPLFGRFVRGVGGDGRPPGLGLGLSIARGFMVAMGGNVEASNREDGGGARVRLVAPAA